MQRSVEAIYDARRRRGKGVREVVVVVSGGRRLSMEEADRGGAVREVVPGDVEMNPGWTGR